MLLIFCGEFCGELCGQILIVFFVYQPPNFSGRRVGARTPDLCRVEATLYQLSYAPISNLQKLDLLGGAILLDVE
jgi:hypothetical protein